jgi:hypothetical protein
MAWPNIGMAPTMSDTTSPSTADIIRNWDLHLQSLKQHLAQARNRMKVMADKKHTNIQFAVEDQVLLKPQPYTPSSVTNRPYPKLSY